MTEDKAQQRIVKLTGRPVSDAMKDILDRLAHGEHIDIAEINRTPEITLAKSHIAYSRPTAEIAGRDEERLHIAEEILSRGSANGVDDNGHTVYNGTVTKDSRLDIVIGLPASGKSSIIVDRLSEQFHSRLIDSDEAKKLIPEFNNGWGASVVHAESKIIEDTMLHKAIRNHDNIVYPKVGSKFNELSDVINKAKYYGYTVNVHFVDLDREIALGRMINRFIEKGRFLPLEIVDKYFDSNGNSLIAQNYEKLKKEEIIDGYSKWDNNVERGENAKLVESNLEADFARGHRLAGGRSADKSGVDAGRNGHNVRGSSGADVRTGKKSGFHSDRHRADSGAEPAPNAGRSQISSQSGSDAERVKVSVIPGSKAQKYHKNRK